MSPNSHATALEPWWAVAVPPIAAGVAAAMHFHLIPHGGVALAAAAVLLLAGVIAAVHHAEVIAARIGEPMGSVVLAIAVTVIEVALIISTMLAAGAHGDTLARDTIYAALMIVLNGIVGLCLVLGGARHFEQRFHVEGAGAALSVLGVLATVTLILPNYTRAIPGPVYTTAQLLGVGAVCLCLYGVFLFVQSVRHRDYFVRVDPGADPESPVPRPSNLVALLSFVLLLVALTGVVMLAESLAPALEHAVNAAGLPPLVAGVAIAALVLLPEGLAATRAARANLVQTSLNLALGSALASTGLAIPTIAVASLLTHRSLTLGLPGEETALLALTLLVSTVTLATGRTTILQGSVHLVIFAVFLLLSAMP